MSTGVGKRIKDRRKYLGLTQMELALRMGYTSKASVCKVECGDDNLTADRVTKFANALNCTENYLLGTDEKKNTQEEEDELLEAFRELSDEHKKQLTNYLAFLKIQSNKK